MDIFISYAREDAENANRLYQALSGIPRVTPWLDSKKLMPGVRWKMAIMDALKGCDLFILLLSSNSVKKSGFVQNEISEALEKLKSFPPDQIFLIPARIDECHPKHPELHDIQWVDLFPSWNEGIKSILRVVEHRLGATIPLPSAAEDVVIETVNSQKSFGIRLEARGELRAVDAMEIAFQNFEFKEHDFSGANLVRCSFVDCTFDKALLRGANFEGAQFQNCTMACADLWGANFWGADICGVKDFDKSLLEQTNFYNTRSSWQQSTFIRDSDTLELPDYNTFADYFRTKGRMTDDEFGRTFPWYDHRYFRMMFGKNGGRVFRSDWSLDDWRLDRVSELIRKATRDD